METEKEEIEKNEEVEEDTYTHFFVTSVLVVSTWFVRMRRPEKQKKTWTHTDKVTPKSKQATNLVYYNRTLDT